MATNTKYGDGALGNNTNDTTQNSAFGYYALQNNNNTYNTAVGAFAGNANTGISNSILGCNALLKNESGNYNTAFGTATLCLNMSSANTAIGSNAMANSLTGYENTALGVSAGLNNSGNQNTFLGAETDALAIYTQSTAIGYGVQITNNHQIMMGTSLETVEVPGILNTTNDASIHGLTVGLGGGSVSTNTAVGSSALASNTTGASNTALGYNAGSTNSGNKNTFLGAQTDASSSFTQSTAVGYGAQITAPSQIMMGTSSEQVVIPGSAVLTNTDPASYSQATSIVPKSYVDSLASGVIPVASCQCATTVDITLAGAQTIDGYSAVAGNRVLVKSQGYYSTENVSTLSVANGIYVVVNSGAWTRAVDCSGNDVASTVTFIENGTVNGFTAFVEVAPSPAVAGTDDLQYSVFYSTSFTLGNGLDLSGNTLNVDAVLSGPTNPFLTFVGINGGTDTAYSLDTGTKDASIHGLTVGLGGGSVSSNTAVGASALQTNTTGASNTAVGTNALKLSTVSQNTAVGASALQANTTGASNTAVGASALQANTTGFFNTAVGAAALQANTTGSYSTAVGQNALNSNTSGTQNNAFGASALASNTTGYSNTAMGNSALGSNTSGYENTGIGWNSLTFNTTGNQNTGLGVYALSNTTTGNSNTGIGHTSLQQNTTGYENTAVGYQTLLQNISGYQNTAIGTYALRNNTTGYNNTSMGWATIDNNTTGSGNTVMGASAMNLCQTGANNTAIGNSALRNNISGSNNVAIGSSAGISMTGSNNTIIGYNPTPPSVSGNNQVVLGAAADTIYIQGGLNMRVGDTILTTPLVLPSGSEYTLANFYPITYTDDIYIYLPLPGLKYKGAQVHFKRQGQTTQRNMYFYVNGSTANLICNFKGVLVSSYLSIGVTSFSLWCDGTYWNTMYYSVYG